MVISEPTAVSREVPTSLRPVLRQEEDQVPLLHGLRGAELGILWGTGQKPGVY